VRRVDLVEPRSCVAWWYAHARDCLGDARNAAEEIARVERASWPPSEEVRQQRVLFWRVAYMGAIFAALHARGKAREARREGR